MCRACDVELFFEKVLYEPIGYTLLPWQRESLRNVYGTVNMETGRRQYESAYLEVAKKNGKSFLVGGLPLYHLVREGVENPKAYGAAAAKDQAGLVFDAAAQLYRKNPLLQKTLKLLDSTKRIVRRDGAGFYVVIAADGDVQDGVEPTLTIMDELHRWKTSKARTLYQVLTAGDISVLEPLRWQITTAGDRYESEICWLAHERARQILDGAIKTDRVYARIWGPDPAKLKANPEYWRERECRVLSNPSHEDLGGFLKDDKITSKLEELGDSAYKRYHCNIWDQNDERWMPMDKWAECGKASLGPLVGRRCILGLDLSKNTDFTALVALYLDEDGAVDWKSYCWVPAGQVKKLSKRLKLDLQRWIDMGLLETTPGESIDKETIKARIKMLSEVSTVTEVAYDPRFAWDMIGELQADGFTTVEVKQYGRYLDAPMQWIMAKVLNGLLRHGGHEIADWMMQCVTTDVDRDGLMRPDKEYLARDSRRIDIVSAGLTAAARLMLHQQSQEVGMFSVSL
jgi:phage terminase large subunit-like protein